MIKPLKDKLYPNSHKNYNCIHKNIEIHLKIKFILQISHSYYKFPIHISSFLQFSERKQVFMILRPSMVWLKDGREANPSTSCIWQNWRVANKRDSSNPLTCLGAFLPLVSPKDIPKFFGIIHKFKRLTVKCRKVIKCLTLPNCSFENLLS